MTLSVNRSALVLLDDDAGFLSFDCWCPGILEHHCSGDLVESWE